MFKKSILFTVILILSFTVAAYAQAPKAKAGPITLKMSTVVEENSSLAPWFKKWVQVADEKTKGTVKVQVYWASQLGGEREALEALKLGNVDMQMVTEGVLSLFVPEFKALSLPLLVNSAEAYQKFWKSSAAKQIYSSAEKAGIKLLSSSFLSFRFVSNNVRPITTVADFKGIRMRTMQNPMHIDTMVALGASATPIPYPELYTALQTGVVEGQMNEYIAINERKFDEVQKYLTEVPMFLSTDNDVMSMKTWKKLTAEQQKAIQEVATIMGVEYTKVGKDADTAALKELMARGKIKWNKVEDLSSFRKGVKPVYDKFLKENPKLAPIVKALQAK